MHDLTWRPLIREDAQTSAGLRNAMETVDGIGENYTAEDTLQELIDPYADLEHASLAAFDGDSATRTSWSSERFGSTGGEALPVH